MTTMRLICQHCNGEMEYDKDNPVIYCPYCGNKLLIVESDNVKINLIQNETKKAMQISEYNHEINMEILKYGIEANKNREESKDTILTVLVGLGLIIGVVLIVFAVSLIS